MLIVITPNIKGIKIYNSLYGNIEFELIQITLSGIKSNIEKASMMVADIDKNIGIQLFLFNLGINIRREPKNVPNPAKNDSINDICIFILEYIKE